MPYHGSVYIVMTSLILGFIILATVVGNVFVIAAVCLERNLHHIGNYLIASLAVADLLVASLVMPMAAVKEMSTRWFLGPIVCDAWISFDVLCCTSSILHLVAISLDRYWAVNRVDYIHNRSARRICAMIALSWGLSASISIPPLFNRNHAAEPRPATNQTIVTFTDCIISQNWGYTVFSTVGAFYIPLLFMILIYMSIYRTARMRIRKRQFMKSIRAQNKESVTAGGDSCKDVQEHLLQEGIAEGLERNETETERVQLKENDVDISRQQINDLDKPKTSDLLEQNKSTEQTMNSVELQSDVRPHSLTINQPVESNCNNVNISSSAKTNNGYSSRNELTVSPLALTVSSGDVPSTVTVSTSGGCVASSTQATTPASARSASWVDLSKLQGDQKGAIPQKSAERKAREKRERKRERKAARTLAIITGSFVTCWLPFFILALVRPFCGDSCYYPPLLMSVIGWLGYFNSLLNPVIYTIFNPDFRKAFAKILFGRCRHRD